MKSKIIQTQQTDFYTIPSDWELKELHEVATVIDPRPSHRAPKEVIDGFPYVGIRDISKDGHINIDSCRKVGEDAILEQEKSFEINENSIGFGRNGTVGRIVPFRKKNFRYAISPHFAIINPTNEIDKKFLYAALNSKKFLNHVFSFITGTTRPTIGIQDLRKSLIVYPPPNEQKKIGEIFSNLNNYIQNLKKENNLLEDTAKTIFNSWFINYDGIKEIINSELGKIPKGWKIEKLIDRIFVTYGYPFNSELFNLDKGKPVIRIRNLEKNFSDTLTAEECDQKYHVTSGDILVGMDGEFNTHIWLGGDSLLNQRVCKLISKNKSFNNFFIMFLVKQKIKDYEQKISGTTVIHLSKNDIEDLKLLFPNDVLLKKYTDLTEPLFQKLIRNQHKLRISERLNEVLLPKLMSGEIRV